MTETRETTLLYPPITPAWTNLPVQDLQIDKQTYTYASPDEYRYDSASPQSDRLIIVEDCLSPGSANSSSSSSRENVIKKRKINATNDSTEDYAKYNSSTQYDNKEKDGIDQPIVTSRGKVKQYRCKRCPYVAITKRSFWNHSRVHIKPEKLLSCPKCPFVTEYKHHFESHLLNHLNSKPFKCDKCDYSSVSKNMLDSHLKSHSTLRRYRCAECHFATKYFHQLKVHLDKFEHKEGFMLNNDGTVETDNVIIPRGTARVKTSRRKIKRVKKEMQSLQQLANLVDSYPATTMPLQYNPVNALPVASPLPLYGYDQMYSGYHMFANQRNFVGDQVVPEFSEKQSEYYEQSAPVDYSRRSASLASPSYEEIDVESPVDLSDKSSAPLDLSKSELPKSLRVDYSDGHLENSTSQGDVHQEIQYLRMNLENMHKYVWTLEQNFHANC